MILFFKWLFILFLISHDCSLSTAEIYMLPIKMITGCQIPRISGRLELSAFVILSRFLSFSPWITILFVGQDDISFKHSKQTGSSQKAISLPSSPHEYSGKSPERNRDSPRTEAMLSTWNNVLQSSPFLTKPLIPFEEWNIDFSELTVGTRVGIGKFWIPKFNLVQHCY